MLGREIHCPNCEALVAIPSQAAIDQARQQREAARQAAAESAAAVAKAKAKRQLAEATPVMVAEPEPPPADEEIEEPMIQRRTMPHDHVDMTPMVDITFLLLIFFMSTANFTLQKSLEVPVQKQQKASTRAVQVANDDVQDSVTVQVDEFNAYLVLMPDGTDREASSKQDLMVALEDAASSAATGPPEKLVIEAHRDSAHKAVVAALDAGREKNFMKFQVSVVDDFD
jgi:biopolymer transport protein ExbD